MSNFSAKRRNAGKSAHRMNAVDLAKLYAGLYGYELSGGWVRDAAGRRVCRGWQAFADQLAQLGRIVVGAGIVPRFEIGDQLTLANPRGDLLITVERVGVIGDAPGYGYDSPHGEQVAYDWLCSRP